MTVYEFIVLVLHSGDAEKMGDTTFSCYSQLVLLLKFVFFGGISDSYAQIYFSIFLVPRVLNATSTENSPL